MRGVIVRTCFTYARGRCALVIFLTLLLRGVDVFSLIHQNVEKKECSTSLIIPCHMAHFGYLEDLLKAYESQTVFPDEVVISLSDTRYLALSDKSQLLEPSRPFRVRLIENPQSCSAAGNRNIASELAVGDILIYQDADDLPHPRRIEIIKYYFENFEIDHLMHWYLFESGTFSDFKSLQWFIPISHSPNLGANPAVAIRREVFNEIRWPEEIPHGEDCYFNNKVYEKFPNRIVIKFPFYMYRRRSPSPNISKPSFYEHYQYQYTSEF